MSKRPDFPRLVRATACVGLFALSFVAQAATSAASGAAAHDGVSSATVAHVQARIVDVDADSNSIMLEGPRGNDVVVMVDPDVGDVHKLKAGDKVEIAYRNALLVRAEKVNSNGIRERIDTDATLPISGGETASARSVEIVATVEKIDRKKRLVTLRGPSRTEVFQAPPLISIDQLKVGDSVRAQFESAAAISITRDGAPLK